MEITDDDREMYQKALPWINTYNSEKGVAKTIQVICKFKILGWRVIEQNKDHIIMVKDSELATLFIPNKDVIDKITLQNLICKAGLQITEFFSTV